HYQQLHQHPHSAGSSASTSGESTVGGGVGSGSGGAGGHQCLVTSLPGGPGGSGSDLSAHSQHEFVARLSADSRISFCDQRTANVLGYQPHELLGKLFFDLLWSALLLVPTRLNRFCSAAAWQPFHNPYSGEFEFFVCTCTSAKSLHDAQQAAANQFYSYESSASAAPTNATDETTALWLNKPLSADCVRDNNSMWFSSSATEDYCCGHLPFLSALQQQQLQPQPGEFHHPDDRQLMLMQQQQQPNIMSITQLPMVT
uniref:PAS domain-containing protein n=1 Tax=Macrostomum lignano TaxID=282301 RepID=A0A1I8FML8_9PLAT